MNPGTQNHVSDAGQGSATPERDGGLLRRLLLAVVLLGILGLVAELVLLEHTEDPLQWIPLVLLGVGLVCTLGAWLRPAPGTLRCLQLVMVLFVAAGALGLYLHYRGNVEFELESDSALRGLALAWEALRGATPSLAPGAMVQLGLVGLLATYRHPALRRPGGTH